MKSLITAAILSTSLIASSAFAEVHWFKSIVEAKYYCPPTDSLSYDKGYVYSDSFKAMSKTAKPTDTPDYRFGHSNTNYFGFISGNKVTCYYTYNCISGKCLPSLRN